jgi:dolichol-phosphate mannosyltransferase
MDDVAIPGTPLQSVATPGITTVLAIIVPTLNERENIEPLVALLAEALPNTAWEAIFVDDDSRDGTSERVRALARRNPRLRCLQRIGRRGLATACIEGVLASCSPYIAIMDADLQHDERLLPRMLEAIESGTVDLVIGSRYVAGGGFGDWSSRRIRISGIATRLAHFNLQGRDCRPVEWLLHVPPRGVRRGAASHVGTGIQGSTRPSRLIAKAAKGAGTPLQVP